MSNEVLEERRRRPAVTAEAVFLTGASGFVGRSVVAALVRSWNGPVRCLVRTAAALPAEAEAVRGDLLDPDSYRQALAGVGVVIHLAAATGKQRARRYTEVNVEGTRRLLEAAADAGVERFVYVSSIAATFDDPHDYPYARSKAAAEQVVAASGVRHTILRPTVVFGAGSPAEAALARAGAGPVAVLVGNGRARVQPLDVEQLALAVVESAREHEPSGRIVELGGPETFTYDELVRRAGARRIAHLPLAPVRATVGLLERVAFPLAPVTAGQFSALAHDSVATALPEPAAVAGLRRECDVFCRYLLGSRPNAYTLAKYVGGHASIPFALAGGLSCEDERVLAFACRNPLCARIADAWSRVASPHSALRQKLVLLVAILEYSDTDVDLTGATPTGILGAGVSVAGFALALAAGLILFTPRRVLGVRRA
jgi:NADH dehydrogenase